MSQLRTICPILKSPLGSASNVHTEGRGASLKWVHTHLLRTRAWLQLLSEMRAALLRSSSSAACWTHLRSWCTSSLFTSISVEHINLCFTTALAITHWKKGLQPHTHMWQNLQHLGMSIYQSHLAERSVWAALIVCWKPWSTFVI